MPSIAVTSRSFSKHTFLRAEINKRYDQVTFNDTGKTLKGDELIAFLRDHDSAIIGLERIDMETLSQLPKLKIISRFGVGLDTIDLNAIKQKGVKLAYTAGANKRSVSELVISFAITMLRELPFMNNALRKGLWEQRKGRQLSDACVGIIGLGAIGKDLALLLKAFNCKVIAFDLIKHDEFCLANNIEQIDLDSLLKKADVISLHLPLNSSTQHLLNAERLNLLKSNAILINTARGGLVDEAALITLLQTKRIAGAAFDVFSQEPCMNIELLGLDNFYGTPHIGGSTEEAIIAMGQAAINGLETAVLL